MPILALCLTLAACDCGGKGTFKKEDSITEPVAKPKLVKEKVTVETPLNLSLPEASPADHEEIAPLASEPALPDMFEEKDKKTKVGGKLMLDPSNPKYHKAVEGAEVSIEIKTD